MCQEEWLYNLLQLITLVEDPVIKRTRNILVQKSSDAQNFVLCSQIKDFQYWGLS